MDSSLSSCLTNSIIPEDYSSPSLSPERSIRKCSTIEDQPTIKMEDLEQQSNAATLGGAVPGSPTPSSQDSPRSSDSKPVKKRKSWGQVLPEPKTNLPPRKRAKTADEKEQRRIERVKRNRLAAHNSRERKRQEVELLQNEKEGLEQRLREMEESHKKMAAELAAFRRMMPGVSPQPESLDSSSLASTTAVQDHAPSLDGSATPPSSTINPRQASFPTPESMSMDSVDSPLDTSSQPSTPAANEPTLADLDRTQHSAAMLCDLQCQSRTASSAHASFRWAMILWYLSLLPMWSTLLSTVHSSILTTFASLLPPLRPNLRALARKRLCSMAIPISPRLLRSTSMARRLSTCTPTQAQQILLATSLASQPKSSSAAVGRILRALMRNRPDDSFSGFARGATRRSSPSANSMVSTCRRSKKTETRLQNNRATMLTAL